MIRHIGIINYLSEETYKAVADNLGIDGGKKHPKDNKRAFSDPDNALLSLEMYNIAYRDFGHVWFLPVLLDMNVLFGAPKAVQIRASDIGYDDFSVRLLDTYRRQFGESIVNGFPDIDRMVCSYAEFIVLIRVPNADGLMAKVEEGRFTEPQLDGDCFESYKLRNATPWFTVNRLDATSIRLCAKCQGIALKSQLKVKWSPVGVPIPEVLEKDTAVGILSKQVDKYMKPNVPSELSRQAIRDCI